MFKLLGAFVETERSSNLELAQKKLTRFEHRHSRDVEAPKNIPSAVRITSQTRHTPRANISEADHLHSETQIPVSLLRRALPQRFEDLDHDTKEVINSHLNQLRYA